MSGPHDFVDFDLHGFVGVRLVGASAGDVDAVERQLGPIRKALAREPDITLEFVPRIDSGPLRLLGVDDVGFSDTDFYLLGGGHKTPVKVRVPVNQVGERCVLLCESGLNAVPLLIAFVNLTALARGLVPLHAAGFVHRNRGILCTGWSKGGKTETLLGFMANDAKYVGDEWVYLDGKQMFGIPEPVHVWDWHLRDLPGMRARLTGTQRLKLKAASAATTTVSALSHSRMSPAFLRRLGRRLSPVVWRQQYVKVVPEQLFGDHAFQSAASVDHVVLVMSHQATDYRVNSIEPAEVAERMVHSLQEERADLMSLHEKFRFAFPDKHNALIPKMESVQRQRLITCLSNRKAHIVYHPYPVCPVALFNVIRPLL